MEYIDLYDADRNQKGVSVPKTDRLNDGDYRLTVHICLFNSEGKLLIQQRSKTKKNFPEFWDLTLGGNVSSGETSKQAAHRELLEELGIDFDFSNERPLFSFNFPSGFDDYFVIDKDLDLKEVKFVDGEVQNVKWASQSEVQKLITQKKFIQYYPSIIDFIFEARKSRNMFNIEAYNQKK